jgi:hypothetical protein
MFCPLIVSGIYGEPRSREEAVRFVVQWSVPAQYCVGNLTLETSMSDTTKFNVCAFRAPNGKTIVLASSQLDRAKYGAHERLSEILYHAKNPDDVKYKKQFVHIELKDYKYDDFVPLDHIDVLGKDSAMRVKALLIRDYDTRDPRKGYNQRA